LSWKVLRDGRAAERDCDDQATGETAGAIKIHDETTANIN
jgi:hypothetical protein